MNTSLENISPADQKILLVDDAPENIDILAEALSGYKRMIATSGEKALKIALGENKPDLILLDIEMPGMDGYEVCKLLKKEQSTKHIPIIFLTGKTAKEDIIKGFQLGANDYVKKPFDNEELIARVKTHLELKLSREKLESVNQLLEEMVEQRTHKLKDTLNELGSAHDQLIKVNKSKEEYLDMISREIRGPLNNILLIAELLKAKADSKDLFELIVQLDQTVSDLEDFSSTANQLNTLRSTAENVKFEDIMLRQFIEFCMLENAASLKKMNVRATHEIDSSELVLKGNEDLLMKLFTNVINSFSMIKDQDGTMLFSSEPSESQVIVNIIGQSSTAIDSVLKKSISDLILSEDISDPKIQIHAELIDLILGIHDASLEVDYPEHNKVCVKLIFRNK
jgi:two-component system sensor histidine kinase/response regulator